MIYSMLLFDLDGTLVDSVEGLQIASAAAAECVGAGTPSLEFVRNAIGRGVDRLIHRVCSTRQDGEIPNDLHRIARARFDAVYLEACLSGTSLRNGVEDPLRDSRLEGRRVVVATNKPRGPAEVIIDHLGLDGLIDALVCPEDAGVRKPDPAFIGHALGTARKSEAILVGDSSIDAESARLADIPFLAIRGGYDEGRRIDDRIPCPDLIVDEPRDLPEAVRALESRR